MSDSTPYDITSATVEEFVPFLFDHEAVRISHRPQDPRPWYLDAEVEFDASQVLKHYTRLFTEPATWSSRFSKAQLEVGFWMILGGNLECGVTPLINEGSVSYDIRER